MLFHVNTDMALNPTQNQSARQLSRSTVTLYRNKSKETLLHCTDISHRETLSHCTAKSHRETLLHCTEISHRETLLHCTKISHAEILSGCAEVIC